jgi:hypothetical protein
LASYDGPLLKVRAAGGEPEAATTLDASRKQSSHRFPTFLPDGRHFLYSALPAKNGKFDIFVGSLDGGDPVFLGAMETTPVYAHPGWLVSTRHGVLFAQRFDPATSSLVANLSRSEMNRHSCSIPRSRTRRHDRQR